MGVVGCVYVLEMSRSHLHWSPRSQGREGGLPMHLLALCFFLFLSLYTHGDSILSLLISVLFISFSPLSICLYLPVDRWLTARSLSFAIFVLFLLFCLFLFRYHSVRICFNLLFTHSLAQSPFPSCFFHCLSDSINSESHFAK